MKQTQYRIVPSYKCNLLEYKKEHKFLWFKYYSWEKMPRIELIYDKISFMSEDFEKYVSDYDTDLDKFQTKWINIENYFIFYNHMNESEKVRKL